VREISIFCLLAGVLIVVRVYQLYLNQWLQIRWRRFLTVRYLEGWLGNGNHYRMQMLGDAADNPDQRIAEDVKQFIDGGSNGVGILPVGLGLLNSVVTLVSFFVILWTLSDDAQLTLFGWRVPGFLFWARSSTRLPERCSPCDRPRADGAQFQSAALRSRFPLQSGARAGKLGADRAAPWRDG